MDEPTDEPGPAAGPEPYLAFPSPTTGPPVSPWGAPSTDAPFSGPRPPVPAPPRGRRTGLVAAFSILAIAVIGAAAFVGWRVYDDRQPPDFAGDEAVAWDGDADGKVPLDELMRLLVAEGISCKDPDEETYRELVDMGLGLQNLGDDQPGRRWIEAGEMWSEAVDDLDRDATYELRSCSTSYIFSSGEDAVIAYFEGMPPSTVAAIADLGLRLVAIPPPDVDHVVDLLEDRGDTCMATTTKQSRDILLAQLLPRLESPGATADQLKAGSEREAISALPDTELTVRNCTNATIIGVDSTVQLVIIGNGGTKLKDELQRVEAFTIVDPVPENG